MSEDVMHLLKLAGRASPLSADRRARDFQSELQRHRLGDMLEVKGFLLMRQPPHPPMDAPYYLLSPFSPSELKGLPKNAFRPYLVLRLAEGSSVGGRLYSGAYVRVSGILDAYPWGNLRMLHVDAISEEDYSRHWTEYRELSLSRGEFEAIFMDTIYATYDFEKALIYSLFASPPIVGANRRWGEGFSFSAFKGDSRTALSVWEAMRYIYSLFPWELRLKRDRWMEYVDPALDMDFRLHDPNTTGLAYYTPSSRTMLGRKMPVPKWAEDIFTAKGAVFLSSRGRVKPDDSLAYLSETPFILSEPVAYERNRELEQLMPNVIATVFVERENVGSISLGDEIEPFRRKFEAWLVRNRAEYGEKFDALRLSGMVFETNTRYLLSTHLLGSMARFNGGMRQSIINDVLLVNQELLDMWINELPPAELMKLVRNYERYISSDKRANLALSLFMDIEATSSDGSVSRAEFYEALVQYGFKKSDASGVIERLLREGYLYEPFRGKLRLIR